MAKFDFMTMPASPFAPSSVTPTFEKLVKIWEALRNLNTGGYGSGVLTQIAGWAAPNGKGVTSCSPFTGTALAMLFANEDAAPYKPLFNGSDPLPYDFYTLQNGDLPAKTRKFVTNHGFDPAKFRLDNTLTDSSGAPVAFNLAEPIGYCGRDGKAFRHGNPQQMRRGDLLKLEWWSVDIPGVDKAGNKIVTHIDSGHATFCWDVHLDADGNVDAFQFLSANGVEGRGGVGISVCNHNVLADGVFVSKNKTSGKYEVLKANFTDILDGKDYPEYAEDHPWYALPDLEPGSIDVTTFRRRDPKKKPPALVYYGQKSAYVWPREIKIARIKGITPPEPYPQPASTAKDPKPHFTAAPTKVTVAQQTADPEATKKVAPAPTPQKTEAPTGFQHEVEDKLQVFFKAKWISSDPGDATDVNDPKTQAAVKEFQQKFTRHAPDGNADKATRGFLRFFAPYAARQKDINDKLRKLKAARKIKCDPGDGDDRTDANVEALKDFQTANKLDVDGIPGPATCGKLDEAVAALTAPPPALAAGAAVPDCPQEADLRKKILDTARAEVGMTCDGSYTDAKGRIPEYFKVAFGDPKQGAYCAAFATYCWKTAGVAQMKSSAWVPSLYQIFEKAGRITQTPKPGDLAFVVMPNSKRGAKGDVDQSGHPWPCHVGLVAEVNASGKVTKTIEGNWNKGPGSPSGVYEVAPAQYYAGRICGYGSLVAPAIAQPLAPPAAAASTAAPTAHSDATPAAVAPKPVAQPTPTTIDPPKPTTPLAPATPTLLWGTNYSRAGGLVDLRLHAQGLVSDQTQPVILLSGGPNGDVAADAPSGALFAELLAAQRVAALTQKDFLHLFFLAPAMPDGTKLKAKVTAARGDGSRATYTTDDELTIGAHACPDCKPIVAIGGDQAFAEKVCAGSKDTASIAAVQKLLVKFGYTLGSSKAHPDGADGHWGETGGHALRSFTREASNDLDIYARMNPLYPDANAPISKLLVDKCAVGFKKSWPRKAAAPSKSPSDPQHPEARNLPPITSSKIKVNGKDFVDWFNTDFQPKRKHVNTGIKNSQGADTVLFENKFNAAGFHSVFDQIAQISGKAETPVAEFIAYCMVFYNEEGGLFRTLPEAYNKSELVNFTYLWKQVDGGKVSYNRSGNQQKLAGDQLFAKGLIPQSDVAKWNVQTPFPADLLKANPSLTAALRECDFYKFQGRGLTQITWREGFHNYVVPVLKEFGMETNLDDISTDDLQKAFDDMKFAARCVYYEWHHGQVGAALADSNNQPPEFLWIGYHVGGSTKYGRVYHWRCSELYNAMLAGNYSCD